MKTTNTEDPPLIQQFDFYKDREYYKITPGFFCSSVKKLRVDSHKDFNVLKMILPEMPDKVLVNGEEYELTKK